MNEWGLLGYCITAYELQCGSTRCHQNILYRKSTCHWWHWCQLHPEWATRDSSMCKGEVTWFDYGLICFSYSITNRVNVDFLFKVFGCSSLLEHSCLHNIVSQSSLLILEGQLILLIGKQPHWTRRRIDVGVQLIPRNHHKSWKYDPYTTFLELNRNKMWWYKWK